MGVVLAIAILTAPAQLETRETFGRKGGVFLELGLNWSYYSRSTMRFRGDGYNLSVRKVRGRDAPGLSARPDDMQYTYRLGVNVTERISISLGLDHMKYVTRRGQRRRINGTVNASASPEFAGTYNGDTNTFGAADSPVEHVEHTDGLNLLELALTYTWDLWISPHQKHALALRTSALSGLAIPVTDSVVLGRRDTNNKPHIGGYSISGATSLRFNAWRKAFIEVESKLGYVRLRSFVLPEGGRGSQRLFYWQPNFSLGVEFI